ncbi:MAG: hypothetical protein JSV49_00040, partial [Thermoplasmata archaeon]
MRNRTRGTKIKSIFNVYLILIAIFSVINFIPLDNPLVGEVSAASSWTINTDKDFLNGTFDNVSLIGSGPSAELRSKQGLWSLDMPGPTPRPVQNHAVAGVSGTQNVVLFGGENKAGEANNFTWVFGMEEEGDMWFNATPAYSPSPRINHSMAPINGTDKVLLFGGSTGGNETWVYDSSENTWTNKTPASSPSSRTQHAMAPIYGREEVLLFGGWDTTYDNETWIYNYTLNTWTNMTPSLSLPGDPSPRYGHAMAAIWGTEYVVLFGGWEEFFGIDDDTWVYNRTNNSWQQKWPASDPMPRYNHAMTSVWGNTTAVLYGGSAGQDETWIYDFNASNWIQEWPMPKPGFVYGHAMATIYEKEEVFLCGGWDFMDSRVRDEAWVYNVNEGNWFMVSPMMYPPPRAAHSITTLYNSTQVVMFGGLNEMGRLDDTWHFEMPMDMWFKPSAGAPPTGREGHSMAPVWNTKNAIMFAGYTDFGWNDETQEYNTSWNGWSNKFPGSRPSFRFNHSLASIDGNDTVLFFGGYSQTGLRNDTWIYDLSKNNWENQWPVIAPSRRSSHSMATVYGDDKVVLFGGYLGWFMGKHWFGNDTWVYDVSKNNWTQKSPAKPPSNRAASALAPLPGTDKFVLFGGRNASKYFGDTWMYDLSDDRWTKLNLSVQPSPRFAHAMATVYNESEIVLFGGYDNKFMGDTWIFDPYHTLNGTFISPAHDSGGNTTFNNITWDDVTPPGTSVKFQIRTGETKDDLNSSEFIGPDGTNATYYISSPTSIHSSHNGDRWIQYIAYLNSTNENVPRLHFITINYNRWPASPVLTAPPSETLTNNTQPTFSWIFNDVDSSQSAYQVIFDDDKDFGSIDYDSGEVSSGTSSYTPGAPIADGLWWWKVRTKDDDGDWGPYCSPWNITIDATPPNAFKPTANPAGWTNDSSPEISFSTTDDLSGIDYYNISIDNSSFSTQTSPVEIPAQSDGSHNITIRAFDNAGNYIDKWVDVYIDILPPDGFKPTANPAEWKNDTTPDISFATIDGTSGIDRYEISIDNGSFSEETSPYTLPAQSDGSHNITVRAFDNAGNYIDRWVDVYIDDTVPGAFQPTANPAGWTNDTTPEIIFGTTDVTSGMDRYEISVDNGSFSQQTSPYTLPSQADGSHNVTVRAFDNAGNYLDRWVDVYIDDTVPNGFQPSANPASWTNDTSPDITFGTTDDTSGIDRYEISVDNGSFSEQTSPYTLPAQGEGSHNVTVRAYDNAGNYLDRWVDVYIDTLPPGGFQPSSSSSGWTNDTTPTITFGTTDETSGIDHYEISIDNGSFTEQTSPYTLPAQSDGSHNITVRAYDESGNYIDRWIDVYIDDTVPNGFQPGASPSGWTNDTTPVITFSTTDDTSGIDHYEISIDNGSFTEQTRPYEIPAQSDGSHNITVRAFDRAGNYIDRWVDVYIDDTAPNSFQPSAAPSGGTNNTTPTITFGTTDSMSDIDHYEVSIDNGSFSEQTSPYTLPAQADGSHNITIRAFDNAGNYIDRWVDVYIDTQVPFGFKPTSSPSGWTNDTSPEILFSTTDDRSGIARYEISIDNGSFSQQNSPYTLPAQSEGSHNITVRAFDNAENYIDRWVDVYIDTTPPDGFQPTANPSGWTNDSTPEISFVTTDDRSGIDHYEISIDNGSFSTQSSPYEIPAQSDGSHNITVRAFDRAGNYIDRWVDVYIDISPPASFKPTANPSGWTNDTTPEISFSTTDGLSDIDHYEVSIDNGSYSTQSSPYEIPPHADGSHNVTVRAYDNAGNYIEGFVDVYIDTLVPLGFKPGASPSGWTNDTTPDITFSTTDVTSGVDHYEVSVDNGSFSEQTSPYSIPSQSEGSHNITVRAFDRAVNYLDRWVDVYIDITVPSGFMPSANPSGWTTNTQPQISFATMDALSGIDHYEVCVDNGSFSQQTSPYTLPVQSDGSHNITVRAFDRAGNYLDRWVDVYIDTSPPNAFKPGSSPTGWTNDTTPQITFSTIDIYSGLDRFEVSIDNGSFSTQTSPYTIPAQTDGSHNITVRAFDNVGNSIDRWIDVYIDNTGPNGFGPSASPSSWTNTAPQISFSATDDTSGMDHYEVKIDTGSFSTRTSPYTISPMPSDGTHNITVRAYDNAGNYIDRWVDIFTDVSSPYGFAPSANPSGWTTNKQPQISFTTNDATSGMDHYEVKVDSGGFSTQTDPYTISPALTDGTHNITVRAYDNAGNYLDRWVDVHIDNSQPGIFTPTATPSSWTQNTQPQISFETTDSHSGINRYEVKVDSGSFQTQVDPYTLPSQNDGTHLVTVRAYDNVGNYRDGTVNVYIDTTAPESITVSADPSSWTQNTQPEITFSATDANSGVDHYEVKVDDGTFSTQTSPYTLPELSDGTHTITVRAIDIAGNNEDETVEVYIDTSVPESFTPVADPDTWTYHNQPEITFETTDPVSDIDHFDLKIDGGSFSTQTSPYTLPALNDGVHIITVRAYDLAGNYIDGTVQVYID